MSRPFAQDTEVSRCAHNSTAEMVHPNSIHQDASKQRMLAVGQPLGISQASAGRRQIRSLVRKRTGIRSVQDRQFSRRDGLPGLIVIAPVEQMGGRNPSGDFGEHANKILDRFLGPDCRGFLSDLAQLLFRCRIVQCYGAADIQEWVIFEELVLFGRSLVTRCSVCDPGRLTQVLGKPRDLLVKNPLNGFFALVDVDRIHLLRFALDLSNLLPIGIRVERDSPLLRREPVTDIVGGLKDRPHSIVVHLRDRIVAVVVALGTTNRKAQKRGGNNLDRVGDDLISRERNVSHARGARAVRGHAQETGGDQFLHITRTQVAVRRTDHLVAGELFLDKNIERLVEIVRPDHVIAVLVGVRSDRVGGGVAFRVGVARHVQPVPAPALAVTW